MTMAGSDEQSVEAANILPSNVSIVGAEAYLCTLLIVTSHAQ